jgi:hypothetical protein
MTTSGIDEQDIDFFVEHEMKKMKKNRMRIFSASIYPPEMLLVQDVDDLDSKPTTFKSLARAEEELRMPERRNARMSERQKKMQGVPISPTNAKHQKLLL